MILFLKKTIIVNNQVFPVEILRQADGSPRTVFLNGLSFDVEIEKIRSLTSALKHSERRHGGDIKSNLPGQVLIIPVSVGDKVEKGQPILILESMKMENKILSPIDGIVKTVLVSPGQVVLVDELIMQII